MNLISFAKTSLLHYRPLPPLYCVRPKSSSSLHGDLAMSATIESQTEPADNPSPAPSATGSTGTSGITVRNGPGGQPLSFRR